MCDENSYVTESRDKSGARYEKIWMPQIEFTTRTEVGDTYRGIPFAPIKIKICISHLELRICPHFVCRRRLSVTPMNINFISFLNAR